MPPADKLSLRAATAALDASAPEAGVRARELVRRIRWADGRQGAGPLSVRALLQATGASSLRAADTYARLGYPRGGGTTELPRHPLSLREATQRVIGPGVVPVRLLSYNTYLLPGIQLPIDRWIDDAIGWDALAWFGIPFGGALLALLGVCRRLLPRPRQPPLGEERRGPRGGNARGQAAPRRASPPLPDSRRRGP